MTQTRAQGMEMLTEGTNEKKNFVVFCHENKLSCPYYDVIAWY